MATLQVQPRMKDVAAKHLRKKGIVPMALVDDSKSIRLVQARTLDVKDAITHAKGAGMIELEIEGEKGRRTTIVKSYDQDIMSRKLLSVTLMQVAVDEEITADVPVRAVGTPEAVEANTAVLNTPVSSVKVKGKVKDIPDHLDVDIAHMGVGQHINASDLALPAGLVLASSPDATLFSTQIAREELPEDVPVEVEDENLEEAA